MNICSAETMFKKMAARLPSSVTAMSGRKTIGRAEGFTYLPIRKDASIATAWSRNTSAILPARRIYFLFSK